MIGHSRSDDGASRLSDALGGVADLGSLTGAIAPCDRNDVLPTRFGAFGERGGHHPGVPSAVAKIGVSLKSRDGLPLPARSSHDIDDKAAVPACCSRTAWAG